MIGGPRATAPPEATPPRQPAGGNPGALLVALHILNVQEGWIAILGFILAAEALAASVASAFWQPGLVDLPWLVGFAILLGYVLTRIDLPALLVHTLVLLLGVWASVHLVAGGFLPPSNWQTQMGAMAADLATWVAKTSAGQIYQDDMLVALAVAIFLFLWTYISFLAAFRARGGWLAALLLGLALFTNVDLKPATGYPFLILWAVGILLLILRLHLFRLHMAYHQSRFDGWRKSQRTALAGGMVIAAISSLVFAGTPQTPINKTLNELWNRLDTPIGQAQRAYNNLGLPEQVNPSEIRTDSFGAQLPFLGPFRPGSALVMKIRSDQPRYEQGLVFDEYSHSGWTDTKFSSFEANSSEYSTLTALQQTARDRGRKQIAQDIIQVQPKGALLFAAPQPLGASVKLRGDGYGDLRATQAIQPGQLYTSASLESTATASELSSANGAIPATIRQDFLQLPPDMPNRVKQLAEQETKGQQTPYQKAVALESYLRTFAFDTEVPAPPAGRDGVDWFLFDLKRVYCDYTSSSMAVMLRMLGIPARVVSGYAPGAFDPTDGFIHVTEEQAHTWTQAYFPGYGWIDFEPTAGNARFPRAQTSPPTAAAAAQAQPTPTPVSTPTPGPGPRPTPQSQPGATKSQASARHSSFPWLLLLAAALVLAGGLYFFLKRRLVPTARLAYARLALVGTLLGIPPRGWQTPREFGKALKDRRGFEPAATDTITSLYGMDRYSGRLLNEEDHKAAWSAWQRLKARLLRRRR